jgi:hypothetical protein
MKTSSVFTRIGTAFHAYKTLNANPTTANKILAKGASFESQRSNAIRIQTVLAHGEHERC